jgi:hypothetical protein
VNPTGALPPGDVRAGEVWARGSLGVIERVMAWTLCRKYSLAIGIPSSEVEMSKGSLVMWRVIPVKGTSEDEVVIGREAAQTGLVLALVDQTTCLVDDDQGEDCPGGGRHVSCTFGIRDRMMAWTHMMGGVKGVRGPDNVAGRGRKEVYCACSMPCR